MHCLITAFGVVEELISPGENELRLIGETMRIFHETPILDAVDVNGEILRLQAVFQPLSGDDVNHIWSNQTDASFRTSVAYEMSLGVIVPTKRKIERPLVGAIGSQAFVDISSTFPKLSLCSNIP